MAYVFFVYGLAFFVLGFGALLYPKRQSRFRLAKQLYLIAWFGIIHGVNEWLDLFIHHVEPADHVAWLVRARAVTLPVSFVFLILFGTRAMRLRIVGCRACRVVPAALILLWAALVGMGGRSQTMWDVWSRYVLGLPGGLLAGIALLVHGREFARAGLPDAVRSLRVMGVTFIVYGVIAGTVVPRADVFPASVLNYDMFLRMGIPVQVLRSVCAVVAAFGIVRVLGVFNEESRRALHQSRLRFERLAQETPVVLVITDVNSVVTFAQGKGLSLLGLDVDGLSGRQLTDVFADVPQIGEYCDRALQGQTFVRTVGVRGRSFEMYFGPLGAEHAHTEGALLVGLDVTLLTQAQAELETYRQEIARTRQMALLGAMSEAMVDQVGEPLAVARVMLERVLAELNGKPDHDQQAAAVRNALSRIGETSAIIEGFYERAHLEPKSAAEPIDLQRLLERIIAAFERSAQQANLRIGLGRVDAVPCLRISAGELEQIFFVLIQNAIDAAAGRDSATLEIRCLTLGQTVRINLTDTCGGMEAEQLEHVFDPFFQTRPDGPNRGFGLAIARQILATHGGTISATSEPGKGTTFQIELPMERAYPLAR